MATSQSAQLAALLKKLEPAIQKAFIASILKAGAAINQKALIESLSAGDLEGAAQLLRIEQAALFPLVEAVRGAFVEGGLAVGSALPKGISGKFGFDGRSLQAEQWVRTEGARLIQGIEEESLAQARLVIRAGLEAGFSPAKIARELTGKVVGSKRVGGFLGLTTQQTDSIIRGRAKLSSGNPALMREYMDLKLRNRNYDATINRAISSGTPLTGSQIDTIIEAHKTKALGYRGQVIAKNEAFTAQAAGQSEGFRQVLARGDVEAVTKRWQHNLSEFPREEHVEMDGTVVDFDEDFVMSDGVRMSHPHDPRGGAKHSVGCRCVAIYRVVVAKE